MFQKIATALLLRTIARDLGRLADSVAGTNQLLTRLTERFAPLLPEEPSPAVRASLRGETGVSHVDADDVALSEAFVARMEAATGHTPDEDEILIHLADEKTHTLAERLAAREHELARLMEARR